MRSRMGFTPVGIVLGLVAMIAGVVVTLLPYFAYETAVGNYHCRYVPGGMVPACPPVPAPLWFWYSVFPGVVELVLGVAIVAAGIVLLWRL